jgi:hypothetical protein
MVVDPHAFPVALAAVRLLFTVLIAAAEHLARLEAEYMQAKTVLESLRQGT